MKHLLFAIVVVFNGCIYAQKHDSLTTLYGQLIDSETMKGIEYVNIGIINTPIGCISMNDGDFTIEFDFSEYIDSAIHISAIGYESKQIKVSSIDTSKTLKLLLKPRVYQIESVAIHGQKLKLKQYGVKNTGGGFIHGMLRGIEKAYYVPVKKEIYKMKNVNFCVRSEFDTVNFRVNFYDHVNQTPNNRICDKNLIFTGVSNEEGWIECDLSTEELYFDSDFFIAVELLPILKNDVKKKASFKAKIGGKGKLFTRDYLDSWVEIKGLGIPFYINYFQVKE